MATYLTPGIYVEEKKPALQPIEGVSTSVGAFIGVAQRGPVNKARLVTSLSEFVRIFGGPIPVTQERYLYYAVRHFFAEGGTKCYVVRVTGYSDVNDAVSLQAVSAHKEFSAMPINGTTAVPAFRVSAINEGMWGEKLRVQVEPASRFSVLLAEDIPAGNVSQLTLRYTQDVQVGTVLYAVEQVTGMVTSVNATTNTIEFRPGLTAETESFTTDIPVGATVFSPDWKFQSVAAETAKVPISTVPTSIKLATILNLRGEPLKAGDLLNFAITNPVTVVAKKIVEKPVGGETGILVQFDEVTVPPRVTESPTGLDHTHVKVYARDFDIIVKDTTDTEKDGGETVETHLHLSLIDTNRRDYLNVRLGPDSGASNYIAANETVGANGAIVPFTAFVQLNGGDDGLTGTPAFNADDIIGSELTGTGLFALDTIKDASILVIPNASDEVARAAIAYCEKRKDLFFVMDLPSDKTDPAAYVADKASSYAAIYYPWITDDDPFTGKPLTLPPSGAVAGSYAQTDVSRGVHKAPAGVENGYLNSATGIQRIVGKGETDILYPKKINVIRKFPEGILIWGTRTLSAEPAWRYVNVRRLFMFLESSLERGLQWVVFEPNDFTLWKNITRNVSAFLRVQWQEGKLVGAKEEEAFFVRCDETTNTPDTINVGQVITEIGIAPSKSAEFVVFRFKQFIAKAS